MLGMGDKKSPRGGNHAIETLIGPHATLRGDDGQPWPATIVPVDLSPFFEVARLLYEGPWVAERLDGYRMTTFAYPFGDATLAAKRRLGGRFALSSGVRDGINAGRTDRNLLQAIGLESRRLPGYDLEALVAETASSKGLLIAYGHDVSDAPTPYGCRPEDIDQLIQLARAADLNIQPVAAAWRMATA